MTNAHYNAMKLMVENLATELGYEPCTYESAFGEYDDEGLNATFDKATKILQMYGVPNEVIYRQNLEFNTITLSREYHLENSDIADFECISIAEVEKILAESNQ